MEQLPACNAISNVDDGSMPEANWSGIASGHNILILYNRNRVLREYQFLTFGEG